MYGNTEIIADRITQAIGGEADQLYVTEASSDDISLPDLVIFGCPTQRFYASPHMRDFINGLPDGIFSGKYYCTFDTRYHKPVSELGSGAIEIDQRIHKRGGIQLLPPMSFFVAEREGPLEDGEADRAENWGISIKEKMSGVGAG